MSYWGVDGAQCKSGDGVCGQDTLGGFWTSADWGARDPVLGQKPVATGSVWSNQR